VVEEVGVFKTEGFTLRRVLRPGASFALLDTGVFYSAGVFRCDVRDRQPVICARAIITILIDKANVQEVSAQRPTKRSHFSQQLVRGNQ
jgi:hypothetical protein